MQQLSKIKYRNDFVNNFEGDQTGNLQPRQTPKVFYSKAIPTPVRKPELLAWSEELASELGIARPANEKDLAILAGNHVSPTMRPYAACYGGHQFGHWAGQLGDGRAITLAEHIDPSGKSWELQLKGAGPTAYSRRADGRAVLRSSLREYLMSEAMHYLGIPTTRALSLVSTGEQVLRDMFYDGHPQHEPGAIVMRVAPSFLRFGNFEILAARKETDQLRRLVNWTISRYYPHISGKDAVLQWFREITQRTALLMVEWLRVGFVHGVMNTDNMSILGLTIDYGPFSFMDDYNPDFTPNTTDLPGRRYAFGRQPSVAMWNLGCLAGALVPLFETTTELEQILNEYDTILLDGYYSMMVRKTGLDELREEDKELFSRVEKTLSLTGADMTIFYQLLAGLPIPLNKEADAVDHFRESFYQLPGPHEMKLLYELVQMYQSRIGSSRLSETQRIELMRQTNPRFIARNYLLHQAIEDLEKGDDGLFRKLQDAIRDPYSDRFDEFFARRPEWAGQKAGCSMLSCSS